MSTPNASAGSGLVSFKTKLLSAVCSNVVICLNTVSTVSANANDTKRRTINLSQYIPLLFSYSSFSLFCHCVSSVHTRISRNR